MKKQIVAQLNFLQIIIKRFFSEGYYEQAAVLTVTSLLAIVPLMSVTVTILASFPVFQHVATQIQQFIFSHFLVNSGQLIVSYLQNFMNQAAKLSVSGLLFLMVTALLMIRSLEKSFNLIWKVRQKRQGLSAFLVYWAMLTLTPILLGASFVVSSYVLSLPLLQGTANKMAHATLILNLSAIFITTLAFYILYSVIPNTKVPLKAGLVGAAIAAVCFELAKKTFTVYILHFSSYQMIYGALATIPIFFLWVYLSWIIILFGVLLTHSISQRNVYRAPQEGSAFIQALTYLNLFWQAQRQGQALSLFELLKSYTGDYPIAPEDHIKVLLKARYLHVVDRDHYILSRDLSAINLYQLYQDLPWKLPNEHELTHSENFPNLIAANQAIKENLTISLAELFSVP
ncbi:MAG: YihY family inner membrane protein [Legionellales bacterium]|nr:YihY family inner membrane protein [Legionellales bacterium]